MKDSGISTLEWQFDILLHNVEVDSGNDKAKIKEIIMKVLADRGYIEPKADNIPA